VRALPAGGHHLGQSFAVVFLQLPDALVQAGEGLAVRRQHQRVLGQRQVALQRVEEQRQRVASGSTS
jgi:hypothetical protein